jgi:tetratricopeptide (TPR) repeat protein
MGNPFKTWGIGISAYLYLSKPLRMKNNLLVLVAFICSPVFAQTEKDAAPLNPKYPSRNPQSVRAVVIGVSTQQDSLLTPLPANQQNAEVYAAFLRSRGGGLLPADHVQLLTGEQATMASFTTAIGWLEEESQLGDQITLYFAGNARLLNSDDGPAPHLFLADSPLALGRTGSMPLARICYLMQEIALKKSLKYSLVFDLNMASITVDEGEIWLQWLEAIQKSFPFAWLEETLEKPWDSKRQSNGFSPILLEGLLGEADINGNELISPKEAGKHLRSERKKAPGGYAMLLAFSNENAFFSSFDATRPSKNYAENSTASQFPALVSQELSHLEDSLLAAADGHTRQWYQDFILTMKLGKLMEPAGRCTSDLYDSLLTQLSLRPLHNHLRRQLAAALQDETQQVLNDYLRTDTRELQRRWKHGGNYAAYPEYMARAVELLGEKHFMHPIIQCKRYYFEGLTARLDFEKNKHPQLLQTALVNQQLALQYEPEAPFVLNEIGILHFLMKSDTAKAFYLQAINLAPQWGIPYLNIAVLHHEKQQFDSALVYAQLAVDLIPWNPVAVAFLGRINLKLEHYAAAEFWLRNAASLDPTEAAIYYDLSCTKALQGHPLAALQWLELAFKYGYKDYSYLMQDEDLINLQNSEQFDELLRKYFPDQVKD